MSTLQRHGRSRPRRVEKGFRRWLKIVSRLAENAGEIGTRFQSIAAAATAMGAAVSLYSTGVNTGLVSDQVDEKHGHRVFPRFDRA